MDTSLTVAPAVDTDADALGSLFATVVAPLPYYNAFAIRSELAKYTPPSIRRAIACDASSALVAKNGSTLVGFCFSHYDDGLIWLDWFGVHPQFRRLGIASELLRSLEKSTRRRDIHKIWCDCRTTNTASKAILTLHQYQEICSVQNHWYGQDFILWEKYLS